MTQRRRAQTLNVFVKALEGTRVVVELRRDTIVRGLLQEVRHILTGPDHFFVPIQALQLTWQSKGGFATVCDGAQRFVVQVDSEMNLTLVDVTCRALEGKAQELEFLYVKGRSVRCD